MESIEKKLSVKQKRVNSVKKTKKSSSDISTSQSNCDKTDPNNILTSQSNEAPNKINLTDTPTDDHVSKSKIVKVQESVPKLYIRLKKSIKALSKTSEDLIAMHPLIKSVRLPRQKENSKFFFAICQSEENALKAAKELREREDCYVRPAFKVSKKEEKKSVAPKSKLRYFWQ